ncbi:MAG: helix-hairpin-helix domain-containing protein [Ekhidna sp.]|nr:helix-hairpin-helix domain-containing protein [Ekhidna sp.]
MKNLLLSLLVVVMAACQTKVKNETSEVEDKTVEVEETTVSTVVNPNLATAEDLAGIGLEMETINTIVENRPYLTMNDFDSLFADLGAADKEDLYRKVFVPFNLNTTAEEDFKLIPGVGDRMAHEFEEYRPYLKLDQFRREIGKYVDETEVARYEQYVFVPVELNSATEEDILALPGVGSRMAHEFEEYRPYENLEQFRKEIGKYVDDKELSRLERFVFLKQE